MCELMGMSANTPTDICFSFTGLMKRGGKTGPHKDGFGVCFYEGHGIRAFHDPAPSCESEIAYLISRYPIKTQTVICHIRKANRGRVCLENTHPFIRELWGRQWSFAHNGQLKGIKKKKLTYYRPVGTTDSEHAFCYVLDKIRGAFPTQPQTHKKNELLNALIKEISEELSELGIFNFLLSNSEFLYAHCGSKLSWITRRAPFGEAKLFDEDMNINFCTHTTVNDVVTIVATEPLTLNENWNTMTTSELLVFKNGEIQAQLLNDKKS